MDPNDDLQEMNGDDLMEVPEAGGPVLGQNELDLAGMDLGGPVSSKETGKSGNLWLGLAFLVLVAIVGGVLFVVYSQYEDEAAMWDEWDEAQAAATDEQDFLRRCREMLPHTQAWEVRVRILDKFAEYRDAEAVDLIRTQLTSRPEVRVAAARALAAVGSPAADAAKPDLLRALEDAGTSDRAAIVWALAVLGEAAATDAIIEEFSSGRLQGQPDFDAAVIARVIGPERLSTNELLNHEEVSVRTLTAAALAEIGTADVIDPLTRMADFELARTEPDQSVLRSIASGLGRSGDARAGRPLFNILSSQPGMRDAVLDSLRSSVGAPGIASLLANAEELDVRLELVRMLARSHDPRAADALAGELATQTVASCNGADDCITQMSDLRKEAAFGLADLGDARGADELLVLARGLDLGVAREALSKVQELGVPQAADGLLEMLEDEEFVSRRANVMRALGTTGATHAGPAIQRLLETYLGENDDLAADPGSAAMALADLGYEPAYARVLREVPRPRDVDYSTPSVSNETGFTNRTACVQALGRYGRDDQDTVDALTQIIEDPLDDARLRQDAGMALGAIANEEILSFVIGRLQDPELDPPAKYYYLATLWQNPSAEVADDLMRLVQNPATEPDVKRAAALAIGYAAAPSLDQPISQMLADETLRREAAFMVLLGGTPEQGTELLGLLGANQDLQEIVMFAIRDDRSNSFNLITNRAFESGELWRRLRVAHILNIGVDDNRHGYVWNHLVTRLGAGWPGHDGMTPRQIRAQLWEALRGDDADLRDLVARTLASMDERGLLMASRDQPGNGQEEAHAILRELNRPPREETATAP